MKVIVVGGGASGLVAAYFAALRGHEVTLLEKNEKLGKKIYITGKGRCNLTNNCSPDEFLENVVHGAKFLKGAIYRFPPSALMELFTSYGLSLKTERGNRVFPVSDHASDVTKVLEKMCQSVGVNFKLNTEVLKIGTLHSTVCGIITNNEIISCDSAVIATGGLSYPSTGSTGDGFRFARELGHTIIPCFPSLTGICCKENFMPIQGISVKNAVMTAVYADKIFFSEMGEFLFTHYGISGPLVLSLSAYLNRVPLQEVTIFVDFKPAVLEQEIGDRFLRTLSERKNEEMKSVIRSFLPAKLGEFILNQAGVPLHRQANALKKEERYRIIGALKKFPLSPISLRGFDEAVVTSGGICLKEINPKTMESKLIKGLYFTGEVLDVDALTGGYNLHICFATGYAAGNAI